MKSGKLSRSRHQRSTEGEDSSRASSLLTKQKGVDLIKSLQEQAAPILEESAPIKTRRNISINIEDGTSKADTENHLGSQSLLDEESKKDAFNYEQPKKDTYNHEPIP